MADSVQLAPKPRFARALRVARYCLGGVVLGVCVVALIETVVLEPFHVPTGSMAPALRGHHRVGLCPCCGAEVVVGRAAADSKGTGQARFYRKAFCQNCGHFPIPLDGPEIAGDRIIVHRTAHLFRTPSRWEIVVFRLLGVFYIKRILGLPGEEILIHDGDVYVDGELLRKPWDEAKRMALPIYDQLQARPERWDVLTGPDSRVIDLDGTASPTTATYRNEIAATKKCEPIRDEYAYNGSLHADSECVHDFLIATEVEAVAGAGSVSLRLCDGGDWIEVTLPLGEARAIEAFAWPVHEPERIRKIADGEHVWALQPGQRCRVELAFVDRRVTLAVDDAVCCSVDLPARKERDGVSEPFQVHADGVRVRLHRFRLSRDVHYGQQGINGVRGKAVRLGPDQYFVLGDNSPNSEDSRFWTDQGRVEAASIVGSALIARGAAPQRSGVRWLP
ncbi:MAG TPA: S26 family signal peptidase [Gemmataceae bacterium]|nr:S26 family signal peptidase [Gemmataceae bacterium]